MGQWVGFLRWRESEILLLVFGLEYLNVSGPTFCFIWSTYGLKLKLGPGRIVEIQV